MTLPALTPLEDDAELHPHAHRDVSGGWLRPTVFGAMDGLVTNVSLISGVAAAGAAAHLVLITGLAGLAAGAFSMATGEYISVANQNELVHAEVEKERRELAAHPGEEEAELMGLYVSQGMSRDTARQAAKEVSADLGRALTVHVNAELGVDPFDLPSPRVAATASFSSFTAGALLPLLTYVLYPHLWLMLAVSALAAFSGGYLVSLVTRRSALHSALRQLLLAALAALVTLGIGHVLGATIS